jgi:hypothetical protein
MCSDAVHFQIQNVELGGSEHKEGSKEENRRKKKKEKIGKQEEKSREGEKGDELRKNK